MDYNKYSKDVHTIIDNLSKEESNHIGNGYWVDSNHIIYRKVEYVGNKPVGFIDVYSLPKFKRYGLIIIAVSKDARGKCVGKKLVNSAIQNCKNNKDIDKLRWLADSNNISSINMAKSLGFKLNNDGQDKKEFIYDLRGDENMSDLYENINENAAVAVVNGALIVQELCRIGISSEFNNYAKQKYGNELILMPNLVCKRIDSSVSGLSPKKYTITHSAEMVDFLQRYANELYNKYKDNYVIRINKYSIKNDKSENIFFAVIIVFDPLKNRKHQKLIFDFGLTPVEYKFIGINPISKKYSAYYIMGSIKGLNTGKTIILNKVGAIKNDFKFSCKIMEKDYENIIKPKYPQVKELEKSFVEFRKNKDKSFVEFIKNNRSKTPNMGSATNNKDKTEPVIKDENKTPKETNVNESTLPSTERSKLDDDTFGIPSLRKYPLNDKAHVLAAIRMFNRVDRKHEKELAHNIIAAMKKYKISKDIIGPKNRLQSYI